MFRVRNPEKTVLEFLETKYKEGFSSIEPYGARLGSEVWMFLVSPESFPLDRIVVAYIENDDGSWQCADNYVAYLYRDRFRKMLDSLLGTLFQDYKVFQKISQSPLPVEFGPQTLFEDYISSPASRITATIVVNSDKVDQREEIIEHLRASLVAKGALLSGKLYFAKDDFYDGIDESNLACHVNRPDWYHCYASFSMDEAGRFLYLNWR